MKYPLLPLLTLFIFTLHASAQNQVQFSDIKAGMHDKWVEYEAVRVANQRATNLHWLAEYKKATIISHKWMIITEGDEPICRVIHVELYCEKPGGFCEMADFTFKQKYRDGRYIDKLTFVDAGQFLHVDCE